MLTFIQPVVASLKPIDQAQSDVTSSYSLYMLWLHFSLTLVAKAICDFVLVF